MEMQIIDIRPFQRDIIDKQYYREVDKDIKEVRQHFKYVDELFSTGLNKPSFRVFSVLAVSNEILNETNSTKEDYLGNHSQEIYVVVPDNYKEKGCIIYGLKWDDLSLINDKDLHINPGRENNGYHELCVGVPESFSKEKNPILASIMTAQFIIMSYKLFLTHHINKIELISYSHGDKGRLEYAKRSK